MIKKFGISALLLAISLICGAAMLIWGAVGEYQLRQKTADYEKTTGYFADYGIYSEAENRGGRRKNATYYLTYNYQVDGVSYTISTDYGTGVIPEMGSARAVYYDPMCPDSAVLVGTNGSRILLYIGLMFLGVPGCMILISLYGMGYIKIRKVNIVDLILGVLMLALGCGTMYMMADSFNLIESFRRAGLWAAIPVLFLICGIWLLIRGIFIPDYLEKMEEKKRGTDT